VIREDLPARPGAGHPMTGKVAVITGASRGIGARLVDAYRERDWAVVASARTIRPAEDPDLLTVAGDIAEPATAGRIIDAALDRFVRVNTLVNNAGVLICKPFTGFSQRYADQNERDYQHFAGAVRSGRLEALKGV